MSSDVVDQLLPLLTEGGVLGLGEPTHGSANAFAWKFGIIHELARRGLLAALAFEESFSVGLQVDAALRSDDRPFSSGKLDAAWDMASSLWNTPTIRAGLGGLQDLNRTRPHRQRVRFLGVDVSKPYRTARALCGLGHGTPELRVVAARGQLDQTGLADLERTCRALESEAEPEEDVASKSGRERGTEGQTAALARNLRRHADAYLMAPDLSRLHRRDTHMASTLLETLPAHGLTVLWAHNEHLAMNPDSFGGPAMGHVLREALGSRYQSVGVLCGGGAARAVDPSTGSEQYAAVALPPLRPGTTDHALRALGVPFVRTDEFVHPGPRRFLGWQIDTSLFADVRAVRETFEVERPTSDFTALAFLPESTPDRTSDRTDVFTER